MDSSFTLIEDKRGSGRAKLHCIGRDIEYREIELERNAENVWELISDSRVQPELLGDRIIFLLSVLMKNRAEFIGTPTELAGAIDPDGSEGISPKKVSRQILQSLDALRKIGITAVIRRSNGKRLIALHRADSADEQAPANIDPVDPAVGCEDAEIPPFREGQRRVCLDVGPCPPPTNRSFAGRCPTPGGTEGNKRIDGDTEGTA